MFQENRENGEYLINYPNYQKYSCLFPNQEKFTESLDFPSNFIKINEGNPLTTCLLIALESYNNLILEMGEKNRSLTTFVERTKAKYDPPLKYVYGDVIEYSFTTSGSAMALGTYGLRTNSVITKSVVESDNYYSIVECENHEYIVSNNADSQIRYITGYLQLYTYFISLGSVLDIFARSFYKLYGLVNQRINWGNFFTTFLQMNFKSNSIIADIFDITKTFNNDCAEPKISFYRNRFVHDGYCPIKFIVDKTHQTWKLLLFRKSRSGKDCFDFNVIDECDIILTETINYLNSCYELLLQKVEVDNQPPWRINYNG